MGRREDGAMKRMEQNDRMSRNLTNRVYTGKKIPRYALKPYFIKTKQQYE